MIQSAEEDILTTQNLVENNDTNSYKINYLTVPKPDETYSPKLRSTVYRYTVKVTSPN